MKRDRHPAVLIVAITVIAIFALAVSPVLAASFSDVVADTFDDPDYPQAVSALSDLGVINGFDDGTFRPHDLVTRQQFAKMVVKLGGYTVTGDEMCTFGDVSKNPSASDPLYPAKYVAVCAQLGITKGVDDAHFAPYKNITRAQAISMLVRTAQQLGVALQPPTEAYYAGQVPNSVFHNINDPVHGGNIQVAEMNNLLWGLWPDANNKWDVYGKATRGEVAHIMWRLEQKMNASTTTTSASTTTQSTTTTTVPVTTTTSSSTTTSSTTTSIPATTTTTVSGATLLFEDDFSDSASGWPVGFTEFTSTSYKDGEYYMECQGATGGWRAPDWEIVDARILADLTLKEGLGDDSCGIIFRERNGELYEFAINAKGQYGLWYRTKSSVSVIVSWTGSEAINLVGATNHVEIVLRGTAFSFRVNGTLLLDVEDATLNSGVVGFTVNSAGYYPVKATLDNIEVWSH